MYFCNTILLLTHNKAKRQLHLSCVSPPLFLFAPAPSLRNFEKFLVISLHIAMAAKNVNMVGQAQQPKEEIKPSTYGELVNALEISMNQLLSSQLQNILST